MEPMKCRLWDKENEKMIYYDTDCSAPNMTLNGVLIDHKTGSNVSYRYERMQFTSLCDTKGTEAYLGDFYQVPDWVHGEKIRLIPINASYRQLAQIAEDFRECQPKIIGNVFQNKDLLKEKP